MTNKHKSVTVSIVSHGHGHMLDNLLKDLSECPEVANTIVTFNKPDLDEAYLNRFVNNTLIINNATPKGFGENHNHAFRHCNTEFYCILNPDVRLIGNPFAELIPHLSEGVGLTAPMVLNSRGKMEDSARYFPTPLNLFLRITRLNNGCWPVGVEHEVPCRPNWVAGMFMLVPKAVYNALHGFDEAYFLYLEDADLCYRMWKAGFSVELCKKAQVIHDAQRSSHRNLNYLRWHIVSMLRFWQRTTLRHSWN